MIKVNLLRDRTDIPDVDPLHSVGRKTYKEILGVGKESFGEPEINPLFKLVMMILPVALLYGYEIKIKKDAQEKVSKIAAEVEQTREISNQKKKQVEDISEIKREAEARLALLKEFRSISKEKLHGIKILDQLQDLVPAQIWITGLSLDRQRIDLAGTATSAKVLENFQKNFEDSAYFSNILIYNSEESKTEKGDLVINFRMKAGFSVGVLSGG